MAELIVKLGFPLWVKMVVLLLPESPLAIRARTSLRAGVERAHNGRRRAPISTLCGDIHSDTLALPQGIIRSRIFQCDT